MGRSIASLSLILLLAAQLVGDGPRQAKDGTPKAAVKAPGTQGWEYPNPKSSFISSNQKAFQSLFTTPDELDKVVTFSEKKTGKKLTQKAKVQMAGDQLPNGSSFVANDSEAPDQKARPVTVRILAEHHKAYSLTLVISRDKDEKHPHIFVSYTEP